MKLTRQRRMPDDRPQLEMTPMIDIVFQLLIFFIVVVRQEDILSMFATARPAPPAVVIERTVPIAIEIHRAGFIYRGTAISREVLEQRLSVVAQYQPTASIVIRCTGDSPHAFLVQSLDICNKLGLRNLSVFSL